VSAAREGRPTSSLTRNRSETVRLPSPLRCEACHDPRGRFEANGRAPELAARAGAQARKGPPLTRARQEVAVAYLSTRDPRGLQKAKQKSEQKASKAKPYVIEGRGNSVHIVSKLDQRPSSYVLFRDLWRWASKSGFALLEHRPVNHLATVWLHNSSSKTHSLACYR